MIRNMFYLKRLSIYTRNAPDLRIHRSFQLDDCDGESIGVIYELLSERLQMDSRKLPRLAAKRGGKKEIGEREERGFSSANEHDGAGRGWEDVSTTRQCTANMTESTISPFPFSRLPREIRDRIYRQVSGLC
jgi:hypothetical protein